MTDIDLSLSMVDYDRTASLIDGTLKPDGINLRYIVNPPSESIWRMLHENAFDAAEMSLSFLTAARPKGRAWTAIPVFPFRTFFHTLVVVRNAAGIRGPEDLAGKRFGLPEYAMTAAVWVRGTLQDDFGVPPSAIRWVVERPPEMSHGGEVGFVPPAGVVIEPVPNGETLESLLRHGGLDAVMTSPYPGLKARMNRTDLMQLGRSSDLRLLFADPVAEGVRYFEAHGFSHINHTVVIQDHILREHPWVAASLYKAFVDAKEACYRRIDYLTRSSLIFAYSHLLAQRRVFGDDPYPYGLRANERALATLGRHLVDQRLVAQTPRMTDGYAEATREL